MKPDRPRVLIANRGEIACRVIRACREMGLTSIALQGPGDEDARHVTWADEVIAVSSYLEIPKIIAAARDKNVRAIHPGYGFLSERPHFVEAVEAAGITFVGPTADSMRALGDKIGSKELADDIGVPTLPWARVLKGEDIVRAAARVGFPLLLKASAGGGGKGMRKVDSLQELAAAAESASAEAEAAFGDGTLFLERRLERPRHIEVQFFGDGEGGAVHLFERDCSLQRRHQKIWEEARATRLSDETRHGLYEAALKLARHTRYRGAGTAEFLVDPEGKFYFLEVNARIQVEHTVTEEVTGVDLVRAQLELALSGTASVLTDPITARGTAIEVRICAEDPWNGFAPTPGRVEALRWPEGSGVRVESGIAEGQVVHSQYDSLIAKLIVRAETRPHALARMRAALEETVILGPGTNQSYLLALAHDPRVIEALWDTGTLERDFKPALPMDQSDVGMITSWAQTATHAGGASGGPTPSRLWSRLQGRV